MTETIQIPVQEMVAKVEDTTPQISETFFARLVGINEAATITGRGKGQIGRDANTKRLPYALNEKGQKQYKVADLYTIYGFKRPKDTSTKEPEIPASNNDDTLKTAVELAVMQERLRAQAEAMRRMEQEIADLRQKQDKQLETIQRMTLLLPAPPTSKELERQPEPVKRQPFWKRLFS